MTSIRLYLVTNQPRRACIDLAGQYPPPEWLAVVSRESDIFSIPHDVPAFGLLYGEDVMRMAPGGGFLADFPRSDFARALDAYRDIRASHGGFFGLTREQFDGIAAWKAKRQAPGVLPAFPEGVKNAVMALARDRDLKMGAA